MYLNCAAYLWGLLRKFCITFHASVKINRICMQFLMWLTKDIPKITFFFNLHRHTHTHAQWQWRHCTCKCTGKWDCQLLKNRDFLHCRMDAFRGLFTCRSWAIIRSLSQWSPSKTQLFIIGLGKWFSPPPSQPSQQLAFKPHNHWMVKK